MELCLGDSALRRASFRPELLTTLPIAFKSSVAWMRTRALGFGSQSWAPESTCFQLFLVSACEASFQPELFRTLPITSKSSVSRLRTRALHFESPPWAPKRLGFQLFLMSAYEQYRSSYGSSFQTSLRVSRLLCIGSGDSGASSGPSREVFIATNLAAGLLDLQGWKVLLKETREVVSVVDEIIHIGSTASDDIFESLLKVVYISGPQDEEETSETEDGEEADYLEFLVPLMEDIVREVDVISKCLLITGSSVVYVEVDPSRSDIWKLDSIVKLIKGGAVGVIPTDTKFPSRLYAIVCDLKNRESVDRLYRIKEMDPRKVVFNLQHTESYSCLELFFVHIKVDGIIRLQISLTSSIQNGHFMC